MNKCFCSISVIIPTFNRQKSFLSTLESINKLPSIPREIIVIDQSDEIIFNTLEEQIKLLTIKGQKVIHIHLSTPSSTISRNIGIFHASQDIVVFCDDDIEFDKDVFSIIESKMSNSNIGLIAGYNQKDLPKKISIKQRIGSLFYLSPFKTNKGVLLKSCFGFIPIPKKGQSCLTEWAMGFFFAVRKEILISSNILFDEKLTRYAYGEDLDFTYRYCKIAEKLNFKNIYDTSVVVNHLATLEYREINFSSFIKIFANRRYLSNKLLGNNLLQHLRLELSNLAYLWSMKRHKYYKEYKKAYKRYSKKKKLIDRHLLELETLYENEYE